MSRLQREQFRSNLNGAGDYTIFGLSRKMNQLVENGSFESGTKWNNLYCDLSVSNNVAELTNPTSMSAQIKQSGKEFIPNHTYLFKFNVMRSFTGQMLVGFYTPNSNNYKYVNITKADEWCEVSATITISATVPQTELILYFFFDNSHTLVSDDYAKVRKVKVHDLTQDGIDSYTLDEALAYYGDVDLAYTGEKGTIWHADISKTVLTGDNLPTFHLKPEIVLNGVGDVRDSWNNRTGKTVIKLGEVDLGTVNWNYESDRARFYTGGLISLMKHIESIDDMPNMLCSKYKITTFYGASDKCIFTHTSGYVYAFDSDYTNAADFKTAMSGVKLVYELATDSVSADSSKSQFIPKGYTKAICEGIELEISDGSLS